MKARIPGGGARNGLSGPRAYPYRGTKTLEAEMPFECEGGCGRRLETDRWPLCAVCRDSAGLDLADRPRRPGLLRIASEHKP